MKTKKFALIVVGNEDKLGLMFVAGEIRDSGHQFCYFDGESDQFADQLKDWQPDFACFSPLCIDHKISLSISKKIKEVSPAIVNVFGGPHIMGMVQNSDDLDKFINDIGVDIAVIGPLRGAIEKIINSEKKKIISTIPTTPDDMPSPAREELYEAIPRLAARYAKSMVSMFGCPYDCSFCSNRLKKEKFGPKVFKEYFLERRPISELIKEGKILLKYDTIEVDWEDDDLLFGKDIGSWLIEFVEAWKKEVGIPLRFMSSPKSILRASDRMLVKLKEISSWCIMGIQCIRQESLDILNRGWQKEEEVKAAHDRLKEFGFSVLLQSIIGLPVEDPIEDAIDTILGLQRIGAGSMATAFPLLLLSGTQLYNECKAKKIPINEDVFHVLHKGLPSIKFSEDVIRKIGNISKLIKIFVKYNMDENWIRALIDIKELGEETREKIAEAGFSDCVKRRWQDNEAIQKAIFDRMKGELSF